MSRTILPRELGVIIRCDVSGCLERFQTANIRVKINRAAAERAGWIPGGQNARRLDYCPTHAPAERARVARLNEEHERRRKERDEKRAQAAIARDVKLAARPARRAARESRPE